MTENDYTPTQITLPNGIVGRVNNPDDPVALEFMRVFQGFAKSFPVSEKSPKRTEYYQGASRPYTTDDIAHAYETLRNDYGLITYEEVTARKCFVHFVFADGMELDYFPSFEDYRINIAQEMVDFVMQYRHLPFDSEGGE